MDKVFYINIIVLENLFNGKYLKTVLKLTQVNR